MEKLFFDLGNSRIKFSSIYGDQYTYHGAYALDTFIENIEDYLFDEFAAPDAVYIVSVTSSEKLEAFKNAFFSHWGIIPIKLESQKEFMGLTTAYEDFATLGSDRWYAMVGALSITKDPLLVIDAGTALTIDGVFEGQHVGGMIVPGLTAQRNALLQTTSRINMHLPSSMAQGSVLASNTFDAVNSGCVYMTSAYLNTVIADLNAELQTRLRIFLTGGDSDTLEFLIESPITVVEDLVIKGMKSKVELIEKKRKKKFDTSN